MTTDNKYIDEREGVIKSYTKDKEVLDFGVGDISYRFLHKIIAENAKSIVGVELDPHRAHLLQKQGYNIEIGDAETIDLGKKFDVIVAGDLIEHLNNPGLFIENVKKHLKQDGIFIFNTPNAYSINFVLRGLFFGGKVAQFPEHVNVYTEDLLRNLLERYEIKIREAIYFTHKQNSIFSYIIRLFSYISKHRNEHMLFICKINSEK